MPEAPLPVPFGTYQVTSIQLVDLASNLYEARSGGAQLLIRTQLCLVIAVFDNGLLQWQGVVGSKLFFDNAFADVCDVVDVQAL